MPEAMLDERVEKSQGCTRYTPACSQRVEPSIKVLSFELDG